MERELEALLTEIGTLTTQIEHTSIDTLNELKNKGVSLLVNDGKVKGIVIETA